MSVGLGITHTIREKLGFLDERLWRRFSARRLELIDMLELSTKKASEQEDEIRKVSEILRVEFGFPADTYHDFDKLVRAAIQSVRRNRKRSSRSKHVNTSDVKKCKINPSPGTDLISDIPNSNTYEPGKMQLSLADVDVSVAPEKPETSQNGANFLSEILKVYTESHDEVYDLNYPRAKVQSPFDKSQATIQSMIEPRVGKKSTAVLPPISTYAQNKVDLSSSNSSAKSTLLHFVERSKTCSESATSCRENLQQLGRLCVSTSIAYTLEVSFAKANEQLIQYLRNKMNQDNTLADFFRGLDLSLTHSTHLTNEIALISLYTIIGACVKDFGFDKLMMPLSECFKYKIMKDYPTLAQYYASNSYILEPQYDPSSSTQLDSLAKVACDMKTREADKVTKKAVSLRFLSSVLKFLYPVDNSAVPKLNELIENARTAFRLNDNTQYVVKIREMGTERVISADSDLEKVFKTKDSIELEISTQPPKHIPIYELTSTVSNASPDDSKIILPPPYTNRQPTPINPLDQTKDRQGFHFLSNIEDHVSPPPKPRFQPLL